MSANTQALPEASAEQDNFCIHVWRGYTERLQPNLVELALASLLRPLVAEHRAAIPKPPDGIEQTVLHRRTHASRRAFWPQRQALAIAVVKAVHLLFDNIGNFADGALEQFGLLYDGHADLGIAVTANQFAHHRFHILPTGGSIRQDVVHPANGSDITHINSVVCGRVRPMS